MREHAFEALGTHFKVTVWDDVSLAAFEELSAACSAVVTDFDAQYSRFKPDSLITRMSTMTGEVEVPHDLVVMLRMYEQLGNVTGGKINPAIGFALSDTGYDAAYSFAHAPDIRDVPALSDAVTISDDTHVQLRQHVLLDLGALGKGYVIDLVYDVLMARGISRFLVDGSGDIRYHAANGEPIVCGLEHPLDATLAIGTLPITTGALCASATNRRRWGTRHHYIDPHSKESPEDVIATWVYADAAALADGLSSALFFVTPESLDSFSFECLIVNRELKMKKSAGFTADLFQ